MFQLKNQPEEKVEHELFDVAVFLKGLHAIVEIVGGIVTLLISPTLILNFVTRVTQGELLEDPTDAFTQYLLHFAQNFSVGTKQFIALYLLSHGIINAVLVVGLFKKKIWAYHVSFVALSIFSFYQLYRYIYNHSIWLLVLTIFDIVVIWLVWKEYKRVNVPLK